MGKIFKFMYILYKWFQPPFMGRLNKWFLQPFMERLVQDTWLTPMTIGQTSNKITIPYIPKCDHDNVFSLQTFIKHV